MPNIEQNSMPNSSQSDKQSELVFVLLFSPA
jgi:hypothetical protein